MPPSGAGSRPRILARAVALLALLLALLGALLAAIALLFAVPDGARAAVAGVLALVVLVIAAIAARVSHDRATTKPRPFDATLTELAKDREQLSR